MELEAKIKYNKMKVEINKMQKVRCYYEDVVQGLSGNGGAPEKMDGNHSSSTSHGLKI